MNQVVVILAMGGKFAITCTFAMVFLYTPELYATSMRTFGLGMCNCMSRVAGIFSPFAAELVSARVRTLYWVSCLLTDMHKLHEESTSYNQVRLDCSYVCCDTGYILPWIIHARIWHSVYRRWVECHLAARDERQTTATVVTAKRWTGHGCRRLLLVSAAVMLIYNTSSIFEIQVDAASM